MSNVIDASNRFKSSDPFVGLADPWSVHIPAQGSEEYVSLTEKTLINELNLLQQADDLIEDCENKIKSLGWIAALSVSANVLMMIVILWMVANR